MGSALPCHATLGDSLFATLGYAPPWAFPGHALWARSPFRRTQALIPDGQSYRLEDGQVLVASLYKPLPPDWGGEPFLVGGASHGLGLSYSDVGLAWEPDFQGYYLGGPILPELNLLSQIP